MKMSWGSCSVKRSSRHGDHHDEPQGNPPGRAGASRPGGPHHEPGRRSGPAPHDPAVPAAEAAGPGRRPPGRAASGARAPVAAAAAGRGGRPGAGPAAGSLRGLQRHPPHGEVARAARRGDFAGVRTTPSAGPGLARRASPAARPASRPAAAGSRRRSVGAARRQSPPRWWRCISSRPRTSMAKPRSCSRWSRPMACPWRCTATA